MVAPISAPILQIVAIPRQVGEETAASKEKVQGHPILKVMQKTAKLREIRASARET